MQTGKEHLRRQVARERKRERIMSGEREKAMKREIPFPCLVLMD